MRVLITGATGFSGSYLAQHAVDRGATVYGLSRHTRSMAPVVEIIGDLTSAEAAAEAVRVSQPDHVFHVAAQTPANTSVTSEHEWLLNNPVGTLNLLEAVRLYQPQARVLIVSSSAIYGHVPEHALPIHEEMPMRPTTMYGVSKATQELVAMRYAAEHGIYVVRARPFNLVGPGERAGMLTSTLAAQIAGIAGGKAERIIRLRHRATQRDFTDIRDAVRAYWDILEHGRSGEVYNVCSGVATPIGYITERLIELAHVSAHVEETAAQPGAGDILVQVGSNERVRQTVGWQPHVDIDRSLADLLATFRS